jgi:acyl-CoA reductase-like NAD-dependent aldehyde dehydrogenase
VIASVVRGSSEDVDRAVRAARRSFDDGVWALADPRERKRVLLRLAGLIDEHAEELAQLESADVGHPISDAHAIVLANGPGYGLAAAVWSSNITTAHRVARRLRAGTVWINTFDASSLATPFGGVRDSGHGRDRSLHALDNYTHLKTTWVGL